LPCCCSSSQETELLAAGFPCIDVSRAGLRRGLSGSVSKGYLFPIDSFIRCSNAAVALTKSSSDCWPCSSCCKQQ
jgi:hypothetical protein